MPRRSKLPKPRFYLKEPKAKEPTLIFLIYSYGAAKILKYSTGEVIHPKYWNQSKQEFKTTRNYESYKDVEESIELIRRTVLKLFREKGVIPRNDFALELDYRLGFRERPEAKKETITMFGFMKEVVDKREKLAAKDKAENPNKRYYYEAMASWVIKFKKFEDWIGERLTWENIGWQWLDDFKEWCFTVHSYSVGHTGKGVAVMKQMVNEARKAGLTQNRIVNERGFNVKKVETTKVVFFPDDFEKLFKLDVKNDPKYFKVWTLMFIGGFTGMRFNMWSKIDKTVVREIEGEKFLEIWTAKTNQQIAVPLDPMLEKVMELNDWKVPELSRQKFSDYGKELWKMAGITETFEKLSSRGGKVSVERLEKWEMFHPHSLRRSFASNFYLMGIPASWLMPVTGHSTEKQFFQYINIEKRLNAKYVSRYMKQLAKFRNINTNPNLKAI